jgi:protocatechuate 3,4-dioxygenase beta subunit
MNASRHLSRRELLRTSLVAAAGLAVPTAVFGAACERTPLQEEGPFYMNNYDRKSAIRTVNDLTRVPGAPRAADGEVIFIEGKLTDQECRPVKGVTVEIWQACASGRYAHIIDPNPAPMDPYFRYTGEFVTADDGSYSFKSIKPGAYPIPGGFTRPPHVHFKVTGGFFPVLVTQMYFAGEPFNATDPLLNAASKPEQRRLIIAPARNPATNEENLYRFDLTVGSFGGPPIRRD